MFRSLSINCRFLTAAFIACSALLDGAAAAATMTDLYDFQGGSADAFPQGPMVRSSAGWLYGTTKTAVFEVVPRSGTPTTWFKRVIHSFYADGITPSPGSVTRDPVSHVIYGATVNGGAYGYGSIYQLTPLDSEEISWSYTTLFSFPAPSTSSPKTPQGYPQPDGAAPNGGLVLDPSGALYGTTWGPLACSNYGLPQTEYGAPPGYCGTFFKLAPPAPGGTQWTFTLLYQFAFGQTGFGENPNPGLVRDASGAFYGTTYNNEGTDELNDSCFISGWSGCGVVFKLTPPSTKGGTWTETDIYNFGPLPTSASVDSDQVPGPTFGPVADMSGSLYIGLLNGYGVLRLTPPASGSTQWASDLIPYSGGLDNSSSDITINGAPTLDDITGAIFVPTTTYAPDGSWSSSVVKLTPPGAGGGSWLPSTFYTFPTQYDAVPTQLTQDPTTGNLYGASTSGGAINPPDCVDKIASNVCGFIFELTP